MQTPIKSYALSKPGRLQPSNRPFLPSTRPHLLPSIRPHAGIIAPRLHQYQATSNDANKSAEEFQRAASQKADELKSSAQKLFRSASQKVSEFVDEQQLSDKARNAKRDATNKLQDMYGELQDNARRTYWKIDSEYRINEKTRKAYRQAQQAVADVDSQYSVRSRIRTAQEDLKRNWPRWKRQFDEFAATTPGKISLALGFGLLLSTGIFFHLLNLFFVMWWLSVPLSLLTINMAQRQQQEAFKQAAEQQTRQQKWGGFGGMGGFKPGAGATGAASGGWGNRSKASNTPSPWGQQGGGPIIDAEFTTVDDDNKKRRR